MLSVIFTLSAVEAALPPLPFMPPQARLGLSNVVTIYCAFFIGGAEAFALTAFKSAFVFMTRGLAAFALSLSGGALSAAVIVAAARISKGRVSLPTAGVLGAITHNAGQLAAYALMVGTADILWYLPPLTLAGAAAGLATGILARMVASALRRNLDIDK
jgi:heptaprenyl diphosphate synthase